MPGSTSSSSSSDDDVRSVSANKFLIISKMNEKVVDISGKNKGEDILVVMYKKKRFGGKNQLWYLDERGYIRSAFSGTTLSASRKGRSLKTSKDFNDKMGQWRIVGDKIVNEENYYLDIRGEEDKNGAELCAYTPNGQENQDWIIKYV